MMSAPPWGMTERWWWWGGGDEKARVRGCGWGVRGIAVNTVVEEARGRAARESTWVGLGREARVRVRVGAHPEGCELLDLPSATVHHHNLRLDLQGSKTGDESAWEAIPTVAERLV